MAKILFTYAMILFAPIWLPIMVVFGMILGPIGYAVLFYQRFYAYYLFEKKEYKRYLVLKKVGRWEKESRDPDTGRMEDNIPPESPKKAAFMLAVMTGVMFVGMFLFGVVAGPVRAIMIFWRRMYYFAFPNEILKRRKKSV